MTQVAEKLQPWLAALERAAAAAARAGCRICATRGVARFAALGFPTVARRGVALHERRADRVDRVPCRRRRRRVTRRRARRRSCTPTRAYRLVFVNGRFAPALSRPTRSAGGRARRVAGGRGHRARRRRPALLRPARRLHDARSFAALNTAFVARRRVSSTCPTASSLEHADPPPVRRRGADASPAMSHPRTLIVAGDAQPGADRRDLRRRCRARRYFTNAVTEVVRRRERGRSITTRCRRRALDAFHIASMHVHAARSATFSSHSFTLGGKLARNDVDRRARRRGRRVHAERPLPRRRRAPGRQPHDDRSRQAALPEPRDLQGHPRRHARARCSTARSSSARTRRRPTPSRPTARCCCPTTRTINTKPQLEIFADDVKCTHGAAIGQLDEDAIFYLRARGLTYPRRATC